MRAIRILMWVLLIAAVFIAAAYFLPQKVYVERELEIQAKRNVVFNQVNDLHNWIKWSKWTMLDPKMEITYFEHGIGEGAGYEWTSENKNVGSGKLKIIESVKYDSVKVEMDFMAEGKAVSRFKFVETESGTFVNWNLVYDVGYNPMARWMGLMMDKFIGPDFEEGLQNLNTVCQIQSQKKNYPIEIVDLEDYYFVSLREAVNPQSISEKMGEMYAALMTAIQEKDINATGMPFSIYHEINETQIDLECGIPVDKQAEFKAPIKSGKQQPIKCVKVEFFGDYGKLENGHTRIQNWISKHKFKLNGSPIEVYVTDPANEVNPENWQTNIYYPIK